MAGGSKGRKGGGGSGGGGTKAKRSQPDPSKTRTGLGRDPGKVNRSQLRSQAANVVRRSVAKQAGTKRSGRSGIS